MMRTLVARGMLAGLFAAVLATVFAYLIAEPSIEAAIAVEEAHAAAHHTGEAAAHAHEPLVSRGVQSTIGLFTGVAGYAIAAGGLFAVAFAVLHGRLGKLRPGVLSALLAAGSYVVVVLVPFLKYPANPPAVGSAATIEERTALYFGFIGLSILFAFVAVYAGHALRHKLAGWQRAALSCAGYVVVMAICGAVMPVVDEVTGEFPGTVLWNFRVGSLGTTLVLWTTLGVSFGWLVERALRPATAGGSARTPAAAL